MKSFTCKLIPYALSGFVLQYIYMCVCVCVCVLNPPRRYPYFDVVVGLVWSHDPKSYAGGSVCYW
jgi:hypothetical protein